MAIVNIQNLAHTSLPEIVDCLLEAFTGYFVPMPKEVAFWENRFRSARVDYAHSYGAFVGERLVGFIIHGIDRHEGKLTAFNSGTGVIPDFRGQQLVDRMYAAALPALRTAGIEQCLLEVIQANDRAIRVYERIGFHQLRRLRCFKGPLKISDIKVEVQEVDTMDLLAKPNPQHHFYSWDNMNQAVELAAAIYKSYAVTQDQQPIGYFIVNPKIGYLAQLEATDGNWPALLAGIHQIAPAIRINNVDARRERMVQQLLAAGLDNSIDQYEMLMAI